MAVDLNILRGLGITPDKLKEKFEAELSSTTPEIQALRNRIRSRVNEGMTRNFAEYQQTYALDLAWDIEHRQMTPTLVQHFLDKDPNDKEVYEQMKAWGLGQMICDETDCKTGKPTGKKMFNIPMFFNIFVPLVKSYVTIRWANICNARRNNPLFKFSPAIVTAKNRLRCDLWTSRINVMAEQYGYYKTMEQAVLKALHYATCLMFVAEEWHSEEQVRIADKDDVKSGKKKKDSEENAKEGDEIKIRVKEGLRYHLPHPTRTFRDLAYGPSTFNTDTGCTYAGYWRIVRYRELLHRGLWNDKKISLGSVNIIEANKLFFSTVYSGCKMAYGCASVPVSGSGLTTAAEAGVGAGSNDRELKLAQQYYGTDREDQGVLVTEYFEKLIPKDNGLGDYDCPVWFRFLCAGDGCTILYCAPLPSCPTTYWGYDSDESRANNASLSLEILPFQDQFGMVLTQIILSCKQNLANLTLVDEDQVTPESLSNIRNIGESLFRKLNIQSFSGRKSMKGQNKVVDAIQSFSLPKGNVAELINVLKTILDVLERVLVMSSLEVGQAASHEQTREEVRHIAQTTSSRVDFTSASIDLAMAAWKRQLYWFTDANADDDFYGIIPWDTPLTKADLDKYGISYVDDDEQPAKKSGESSRHIRVKAKKKDVSLDIWSLVNSRPEPDRVSDVETAQAMSSLVKDLLSNPITGPAIGAKQALELANRIANLAGIDRDFKLYVDGDSQQQAAQAQEQLKQVVTTVLENVKQSEDALRQEIGGAIKPLAEKVLATEQAVGQIVQGVRAVSEQIGQTAQIIPEIINGINTVAGQTAEAEALAQKGVALGVQNDQFIQKVAEILQFNTAPNPADDSLQ
jgi:hypothetical protein